MWEQGGRGGWGADNAELVVKKDMGNTPVKSFKKCTNFQVINMNLKFCDIFVSFILIWFLHAIVEKILIIWDLQSAHFYGQAKISYLPQTQ